MSTLRLYKNYLFLLVALYKTPTDQNMDTTWSNPIHCILGFAVRVAKSLSKLDKIRSFCTKERLLILSIQLKFMCSILKNSCRCHFKSLFVQNYKENIAMDRVWTSTFREVDYATCRIFWHLYGVIWRVTLTPRRYAFISRSP